MKRTGWVFIIITALLAVGGGAYVGFVQTQNNEPAAPPKPVTVPVTRGTVQQTVTAPGQLIGTQEMILGLDVGGRLVEINVRPGTIVTQGDLLARLDPAPFKKALTEAELALAEAEQQRQQQLAAAELAVSENEATVSSVQAQLPSLTEANLRLEAAVEAENRAAYEYRKAQDRTWEPPEVEEAYRLEYVAAQRERAIAQAAVEAVQNQQWAVAQQVAALETGVAQAELAASSLREDDVDFRLRQAVDNAQADLAAATLTAPFDGVILDLFAQPGSYSQPGSELILLADPTQGEVRTTVIEEDLSLVKIGQPAELFFDARPDLAIMGEVSRIVPRRVEGEARPLYHVYISPTDPLPPEVVPGMTADASIIIDQVDDTLRLPRALALPRSDGTAIVKIWQNGRVSEQTVNVGLRGDVYIAISDGLLAGDEVVGE